LQREQIKASKQASDHAAMPSPAAKRERANDEQGSITPCLVGAAAQPLRFFGLSWLLRGCLLKSRSSASKLETDDITHATTDSIVLSCHQRTSFHKEASHFETQIPFAFDATGWKRNLTRKAINTKRSKTDARIRSQQLTTMVVLLLFAAALQNSSYR